MKRAKTPQGIEIRWWEMRKRYRGYCNRCPWIASSFRANLGAAQADCRSHNRMPHPETEAVAS